MFLFLRITSSRADCLAAFAALGHIRGIGQRLVHGVALAVVFTVLLAVPAPGQIITFRDGVATRDNVLRPETPLEDATARIDDLEPGLEAVAPESFVVGDSFGSTQCCGDCPPGWTIRADGLFFNREGEAGVTLSSGFALGDFDFEEAARISVIRRRDCLDAWELAYLGPYEFTLFNQAAGAGLNTTLSSAVLDLSAFNNAVFQRQAYRSQFQSMEANRRCFGWDVISTLIGLRYLNIDEDLSFNSIDAQGALGLLSVETNNHLVGPQAGLELMFPVGRWSSITTLRGGAFANFLDSNARLFNAGTQQLATSDDEFDFSFMLEVGQYFTVQLTPAIKFRGGYEVGWLWGVALAPEQLPSPLTFNSGATLDSEGDVLYHGATAGLEINW